MPERTALPGNPKARECAGAAAAGYNLVQDGKGDDSSVKAGAILVQKCAAADPEFDLELEDTTSHGYPQACESAAQNSLTVSGLEQAVERVWTIGRSQDDPRGGTAAAAFSVAPECAWFAGSHVDGVMVSMAKKEIHFHAGEAAETDFVKREKPMN